MAVTKLSIFSLATVSLLFASWHPPADRIRSILPSDDPLNITLAPLGEMSVSGQVVAIMTITNVSKLPVRTEIFRVRNSEYLGFRYYLVTNGTDVAKTNFNKALQHEEGATDSEAPAPSSTDIYTMKAGQVDHIRIDLKKLFKISAPGAFTFSVSMLQNMDVTRAISSEPLTLQVTP